MPRKSNAARIAALRKALDEIASPPDRPCAQRYDAASNRVWCGRCCAHDDDPRFGKACKPTPPRELAKAAILADEEAK